MLSVASSGLVREREGDGRQASSDATIRAGWVAQPGDLIVNPMWLIGGGIAVTGLRGAVSPDYRVYRFRPGVHPRYMHHLLRTSPYIAQYKLYTRADTTFDRRVGKDDFHEMPILLPPLDTQRRIADFLDDQVTHLDRAVDLRRRQIALADEAFAGRWSERVHGVGPLVPLRRVLISITDGPFGSSLTSAHYSEDGARVVRLGNLGAAEFRDTDHAYIRTDYYRTLLTHAIEPGDLLIAGLGDENYPLGRACVAPADLGPAIVKADCYRVRLAEDRVSHSWAAVAISSPPVTAATSTLSRGSTRARINTEIARDIAIPLPDLAMQERLVAEHTEDHQVVLEARRRLLGCNALINERKQALITAAVTGQFDVTTASTRSVA